MQRITIDNINATYEVLDETIEFVVKRFTLAQSNHPIIVELWNQYDFDDYFHPPSVLDQPLGPNKRCEGYYQFVAIEGVLTHAIAIILNPNWEITLKHELFHMICADLMGKMWWDQYGDAWMDHRSADPFEYLAIAVANPAILIDNQEGK